MQKKKKQKSSVCIMLYFKHLDVIIFLICIWQSPGTYI